MCMDFYTNMMKMHENAVVWVHYPAINIGFSAGFHKTMNHNEPTAVVWVPRCQPCGVGT